MAEVIIDPALATALKREFINAIKDEGLMMVPADIAALGFDALKKRNNVLKRKFASPNTIEKHSLLHGVKSRHTVLNMIKDGRITNNEWFKDVSGNYQVLISAIKRLNGE